MLINPANRRNITQSPDVAVDVSEGVQMFFQKLIIEIVIKINNRGFLEEETSTISTLGTRVTQTARQLAMKPEGERKWKWSDLYLVPGQTPRVDDIIRIQGIEYRVMSSSNNKEYGVESFELLEDYVNAE